MSTQQVQAEVLGRPVAGTVVDRELVVDFGHEPYHELVLDVDGSRFRVNEDDVV